MSCLDSSHNTAVFARRRTRPSGSSILFMPKYRTGLRCVGRIDHMTKTLVASRQVSIATTGRFVKNTIGLQSRPANSEHVCAKASLLAAYSQATSA